MVSSEAGTLIGPTTPLSVTPPIGWACHRIERRIPFGFLDETDNSGVFIQDGFPTQVSIFQRLLHPLYLGSLPRVANELDLDCPMNGLLEADLHSSTIALELKVSVHYFFRGNPGPGTELKVDQVCSLIEVIDRTH